MRRRQASWCWRTWWKCSTAERGICRETRFLSARAGSVSDRTTPSLTLPARTDGSPWRAKIMRRRSGFTIVELLVAMALILFIMAILSEAFVAGLKSVRDLKAVADMAERLR